MYTFFDGSNNENNSPQTPPSSPKKTLSVPSVERAHALSKTRPPMERTNLFERRNIDFSPYTVPTVEFAGLSLQAAN